MCIDYLFLNDSHHFLNNVNHMNLDNLDIHITYVAIETYKIKLDAEDFFLSSKIRKIQKKPSPN